MRSYIFVYEGFAQFETVIIGYLMKVKHQEVITVGVEKKAVKSVEGFTVLPDIALDEITLDDIDLFIVPGGDSYPMMGNQQLQKLLVELDKRKRPMGAICHGPVLLAEAGLLRGKAYTSNVKPDEAEYQLFQGEDATSDIQRDGHIVTARGNAYVEFAFAVGEAAGIFASAEEKKEYYHFFTNSR